MSTMSEAERQSAIRQLEIARDHIEHAEKRVSDAIYYALHSNVSGFSLDSEEVIANLKNQRRVVVSLRRKLGGE